MPSPTPRVATNTQTPNNGWNSQPRAWTTSTVDPRTANPSGQSSTQVGSTFGAQPMGGYSNTTNPNSTAVPSSNSTSVVPTSSLTTNGTRTTDDGYSRQSTTSAPSFDAGRTGAAQQPSSLTPSTTSGVPAPSGIPSSSSSWPPSSSTGTSGSSSGLRPPSFGSSSVGDTSYSRGASGSTSTPAVSTVGQGQPDQ